MSNKTMKWKEVTEKPFYGSLSPTDRYNMQLDYFDDVVTPVLTERGAGPEDVKVKFKEFFTENPPPEGFKPEYFPKRLKKIMKMQKRLISDTDVDFDRNVTHMGFQMDYTGANTDKERRMVFRKYGLGPDDVRPLARGGHALNPSGMERLGLSHHGQPTAIDSQNVLFDPHDIAKFTREGLKIAPEVAAGMRGNMRGLVGSALMTGLAGAAVEAADEAVQHMRGVSDPNDRMIGRAVLRGGLAGGADLGVRMAQPLARKAVLGPQVSRPWKFGTGKVPDHPNVTDPKFPHAFDPQDKTLGVAMQPENIARTEHTFKLGLRPMIKRAAETGEVSWSHFAGAGQEVLNRIMGNPNLVLNTKIATELADEMLKKAGGKLKTSMGASKFGVKVSEMVKGEANKYNKLIAKGLDEADKLVDKSVRSVQKLRPVGGWSYENIQPLIRGHKKKFADKMAEQSKFLDQKNANAKVISTGKMMQQLKKWEKEFPESGAWMSPEMREYFGQADAMVNPDGTFEKISFKQLQTLRSLFSGAAHDDGLLKVVGKYRAGQMKKTMDAMMDQAIRQGNIPPALKKKLTVFNEKYTQGMEVYEDQLILKLAKEGRDRMPLNKISERLLDMDVVTSAKLRKILPKNDFNKMGNSVFADMVEDSTDPATGHINPSHVLSNIKRLKKNRTFEDIFPGKDGLRIERTLKELESRGYEGNLKELLKRDTDVSKVLQKAIEQQDELRAYMEQSFVKELSSPNPEKAMHYATTNPKKAKEMMDFLADHPQMESRAKRIFMESLLRKTKSRTKETVGGMLDGKALQDAIKKIDEMSGGLNTEHPGRIILGNETWDSIRRIAEAFRQTEYKAGGGIAAASRGMKILLSPIKNLGEPLKLGIMAKVLSDPGVTRYFSTGLKRGVGGAFHKVNRARLGMLFRGVSQALASAMQGAGAEFPRPELDLSDSEVYREIMQGAR